MSFLRTPTESPLYAGPADGRLRAVLADPRSAGLAPADLAAFEFADKVAADPTVTTEADIQAPFADLVPR